MTDEPTNAEPSAINSLAAMLDQPFTELTVDELMALKAEFEAREIYLYNGASPEQLVLFAAIAIYSKALLETLASKQSPCARAVMFRQAGAPSRAGTEARAFPRRLPAAVLIWHRLSSSFRAGDMLVA